MPKKSKKVYDADGQLVSTKTAKADGPATPVGYAPVAILPRPSAVPAYAQQAGILSLGSARTSVPPQVVTAGTPAPPEAPITEQPGTTGTVTVSGNVHHLMLHYPQRLLGAYPFNATCPNCNVTGITHAKHEIGTFSLLMFLALLPVCCCLSLVCLCPECATGKDTHHLCRNCGSLLGVYRRL